MLPSRVVRRDELYGPAEQAAPGGYDLAKDSGVPEEGAT